MPGLFLPHLGTHTGYGQGWGEKESTCRLLRPQLPCFCVRCRLGPCSCARGRAEAGPPPTDEAHNSHSDRSSRSMRSDQLVRVTALSAGGRHSPRSRAGPPEANPACLFTWEAHSARREQGQGPGPVPNAGENRSGQPRKQRSLPSQQEETINQRNKTYIVCWILVSAKKKKVRTRMRNKIKCHGEGHIVGGTAKETLLGDF